MGGRSVLMDTENIGKLKKGMEVSSEGAFRMLHWYQVLGRELTEEEVERCLRGEALITVGEL